MNKIKDFFKKYQKIFYAIIFAIFILLELFFIQYHEHWADEAQSWLIARDTSFIDILKYIKYEGTPPLWVFIVKIFITLGLPYSYFSIISLIATSIGVYLLLFKTDLPWYIKLLFPFTYSIFYQMTIIARSYCLVFPGLMLIYLNYNKRFENPLRYFLILFFFMSISLHTYLIAGSLFALYLYDYWKIKKEKAHIRNNNFIIASFVLIFIAFLANFIILFPDQYMGSSGALSYNLIEIFGEATFSCDNMFISIISCILFAILVFEYKSLEKIIKIIAVVSPLILIFVIICCIEHHLPILFLLIFFIAICNYNNKFSKIYLITLLIFQFIFNINTVKFDYFNDYEAGSKVATFLEELDFRNKNLNAIGYHVVSIQPYFEKNIFNNYGKDSDKAYYIWAINHDYDETLDTLPDICVLTVISTSNLENGFFKTFEYAAKKLVENNYVCYSFPGYHYYKLGITEIDNLLVFVSPSVNEEVDKEKYTEFNIPESYFSKNN